MTETLLPCPFCGSDALEEYDGKYSVYVTCLECSADGPIHAAWDDESQSLESTGCHWNKRGEAKPVITEQEHNSMLVLALTALKMAKKHIEDLGGEDTKFVDSIITALARRRK